MQPITPYERAQLAAIQQWQTEAPGAISRSLATLSGPATDLLRSFVPETMLRAALQGAQGAAVQMSNPARVLAATGAADLASLRAGSLKVCDRAAARVRRRSLAIAGAAGAVCGVAGAGGMIADLPALITLTFRMIHQTGLCYGEDCSGHFSRQLPIGIFALASANTAEEKAAALLAIDRHIESAATPDMIDGLERAAQYELAKDAAIASLNNLAKNFLRRVGWAEAAGSIPISGALIGGAVNLWYLHETSVAAKRVFQRRWLRARYEAHHPTRLIAADEIEESTAPRRANR
jgi:hypothetical protein